MAGIPPAFRAQYDAERMVGPVFADAVQEVAKGGNAIVEVHEGGFCAVEAEFVVRLLADPPDKDWLTADDIAAISSLHAGSEIASSPLATINDLGPGAVISDHGNNSGAIVGPGIPRSAFGHWDALVSRTYVNGELVGEGSAARVAGGPFAAAAFLAAQLATRGRRLKEGDIILTGMTTGVHSVPVGAHARLRIRRHRQLHPRRRGTPARARRIAGCRRLDYRTPRRQRPAASRSRRANRRDIRRKPMKTPSLLCMAAVLATLAVAPAAAQNVTLRSADIHPDGYPTVEAVIYMGKLVEERTKGRIKIQMFNNAALGSEKDTIEQTRFGVIDMNRVNTAPFNNLVPQTQVLGMPFLFRSVDHMHKVVDGPIGDEILAAFTPHGLVGLAFYDSGARSFYTTKKPVKGLADLKGMKVRVQQSGPVDRHDEGVRRQCDADAVRRGLFLAGDRRGRRRREQLAVL